MERRSKRLKRCEAAADEGNTPVTLPPEIFATVMNYLDYDSVLSCAATSKMLLRDAMPLVTILHIDRASQLNTLASRFRDVKEINIYSLLLENGGDMIDGKVYMTIDRNTVMRVLPFLSHFTKIERVYFGGRMENGDVIGYDEAYIDDENEDNEAGGMLIDMLSAAYHCGSIPRGLRVTGLRCVHSYEDTNELSDDGVSSCKVCKRACQSFPLDQVVNFENEGSSILEPGEEFRSKRPHLLDVCLTRSQIESIAESRSGGKEMLQSNARFLHLLGKGRRYEILSDDGVPLYIVKYIEGELEELKRVIEYAKLDVKSIEKEVLFMSIKRSFAQDEKGILPPINQCYVSRSSFDELGKLGMHFSKKDVSFDAVINPNNLPQIAKGILANNGPVSRSCISLLNRLLFYKNYEKDTLIEQMIDSRLGLLPKLVDNLEEGSRCRPNTMNILDKMMKRGTNAQVKAVIEAGAIQGIVSILGSTQQKLAFAALNILGNMANRSTDIRGNIIDAGALPLLLKSSSIWVCDRDFLVKNVNLVKTLCNGFPSSSTTADINDCLEPLRQHLSSTTNETVLSYACQVLSALSSIPDSYEKTLVEAGLFPRLLELVIHSNIIYVQHPALLAVVHLTSKVKSCTQMVISNNSFPSIISCVLSPDDDVRTVACKMIIHLLDGTNEQVQSFIERGCVRALSSLLSLSDSIVLNKLALDGLKKVVSMPDDIAIYTKDVKLVEGKLRDLEREINCSGREYAEMRNMITSIREVVKGMTPDNNLQQQQQQQHQNIQAAYQQQQRQQAYQQQQQHQSQPTRQPTADQIQFMMNLGYQHHTIMTMTPQQIQYYIQSHNQRAQQEYLQRQFQAQGMSSEADSQDTSDSS